MCLPDDGYGNQSYEICEPRNGQWTDWSDVKNGECFPDYLGSISFL